MPRIKVTQDEVSILVDAVNMWLNYHIAELSKEEQTVAETLLNKITKELS